jgi:hypothetical protein
MTPISSEDRERIKSIGCIFGDELSSVAADACLLELENGWGPWHYEGNGILASYVDCVPYTIDLADCTSGDEILRWIFQLDGKQWMTPEGVGHLVAAIHTLLGGPQPNPVAHITNRIAQWRADAQPAPVK